MKGGFCSLAMVVVAVSFVGTADAQVPADSLPAATAVETRSISAVTPAAVASADVIVRRSGAPVAVASGVGVSIATEAPLNPATVQESQGGFKGFFFGSRRRTSNTLMIGGVAFAGIGVGVVKGDIGALMGIAGLLSSIGGLYLAF